MFEKRVLSLRGFDSDGMMAEAILDPAGRGRRRNPQAVRQSRDRDHPRAQCDARLLLGEDRKELTMATLAPGISTPRSEPMTNVARLDAGTAWAAFMRRDRALGRPRDRRGQDHRHLLQAELPGAAAQARECRLLRDRRRGARRRLSALPALQARRGRPRPRGGGEGGQADRAGRRAAEPRRARRSGRLCAAPFPAAVQARPRRLAGGICAGAADPARRGGAQAERPSDRRGLRRRLCGPERLLQRREGEARHDPIGMARRRARRDHPLDRRSTARSGRC